MTKVIFRTALILAIGVLAACSSQEREWKTFLGEATISADRAVSTLEGSINRGHIKNTQLLKDYAGFLRQQKPELGEIADALALDASTSGPVFQSLKSRLVDAKSAARVAPEHGEAAVQDAWGELDLIKVASRSDLYSMMLTDPINVLADMTDGQLVRVEAMSKEATMQAAGTADTGAGSQLVGNPNYGHWRSDSSGNSFWAWYGKYALFSSLFRSPIYYGGWAGGRHYSYYNDYGRSHYTSPVQRKTQNTVNNRAKSKFGKSGKSFQSPYAKTRSGAARTVVKPITRSRSGGFKSAYARSSSARHSASRTSRSSRGGK